MGTRHLIAVKQDGKYKIAQYGQWDGYPEGQGVNVLRFLRGVKLDAFKKAVSECSFLTSDEIDATYTGMDIFADKYGCISCDEADLHAKKYPELSRDTGAGILSLVLNNGKRKLKNSIDFAADSLFCEWAYVINLDTNTFEVYEGFNQTPLPDDEPFYFLQEQSHIERRKDDQYYPVRIIASWVLDELPSDKDFIAGLNLESDEEQE
jgi:hypothetical protein